MKLKGLFSIFALGVFALGAATGSAQGDEEYDTPLDPRKAPPRIYIGPVGGYNYSVHTGEFASIPGNIAGNAIPCPVFQGGTNNGFYAGGTVEYLLGNPKDAVSSIIGKLVYNNMPGNFELDGTPYQVVGPNGAPVNTTVQHVNEVKYHTIDLDILYKLNLFGTSFGVVGGLTGGYSLGTAQHDQRFQLIDPISAQFVPDPDAAAKGLTYSSDFRTITISQGDLPNTNAVRVGIKAGVQYELPLFGNKFNLVPHAFYNFGITKLTNAENWRVNAFQTGVDLRFAI